MRLSDPSLLRSACYVGGAWCAADDGAVVEVISPATGRALGTVPRAGAAETRRAIDAAAAAFPTGAGARPRNAP